MDYGKLPPLWASMFTAFHHGSHFTDENIFTSLRLEKLPSNNRLDISIKIVNLEIF